MCLRRFVLSFLFCLGLLGFVPAAQGLDVPPIPDHYVVDLAGILLPNTLEALETKLSQYERDTSNQVLVLTLPTLDGAGIEDFAIKVAEKWKPGQANRNNGVILIVAKADRKVRIEVGYGLEGALPDAVTKSIIENEVIPAFKQGDFNSGVRTGIDAILKAAAGEYRAKPTQSRGMDLGLVFFTTLFILILGFNLWRAFFKVWRPFYGAAYGLNRLGSRSYRSIYWGGGFGGFGGFGGGGVSGSSGGFSSGGGSFGGGGASGSW